MQQLFVNYFLTKPFTQGLGIRFAHEIPFDQFSDAVQSMHGYALHTVRANDIIQHLQTIHFASQILDYFSGLLKKPIQ